ncbi:MAG: hypothetical protein ACXACX_02570 [Candidatus Hodarchaeales archaeon]
MMVESKLEEEIVSNGIIEKYFRNKHILLLFLAGKEVDGKQTTVVDIINSFRITKKYAWALLGRLEEDDLIEKSEKSSIGGVEYHNYVLTIKARQDLEVLSICLNNYLTYCQNIKISENQGSHESSMKISSERENIVKNGT